VFRGLPGVANGSEPLLPTDAWDLAAALEVRQAWLAHGWAGVVTAFSGVTDVAA
jgi:hypothetical protein